MQPIKNKNGQSRQHAASSLVWSDPKRMGGELCFFNSRVLVKTLFDNLEVGMSIEEFLEQYEGVTKEQVTGVLELAQSALEKEFAQGNEQEGKCSSLLITVGVTTFPIPC